MDRSEAFVYDHVVLGCGVAGMAAAKLLADSGAQNVLVLEAYPEPGGSQRSVEIAGYTFDVGAFYYWESMPFFDMFPAVREQCQRAAIGVQRISPSGLVSAFPFSLDEEIVARGPRYWATVLASIVAARWGVSSNDSAEAFAIHFMGKRLYEDLGMAAYLRRFYGVPPAEIEAQFALSRMEQVAKLGSGQYWLNVIHKRVRRRLFHEPPPKQGDLLVRPRAGFAAMYAPAVTALEEQGVEIRFSTELRKIERTGWGFTIRASQGTVHARNLVSTVPVEHLCRLLGSNAGVGIRSSSLISLYLSFAGTRAFSSQILYNFGSHGRWKRLTMHSDYYGKSGDREYLSVEIPYYDAPLDDLETLFHDFERSCLAYGILRGDLRLEGGETFSNAYPAHVVGSSSRVDIAMRELAALGVNLVGRQGRFEYLPTGMHVLQQVRRQLAIPSARSGSARDGSQGQKAADECTGRNASQNPTSAVATHQEGFAPFAALAENRASPTAASWASSQRLRSMPPA